MMIPTAYLRTRVADAGETHLEQWFVDIQPNENYLAAITAKPETLIGEWRDIGIVTGGAA